MFGQGKPATKITVCNRVHLGPVNEGSLLCFGCGATMTQDEREAYWRIQIVVRTLIHDSLTKYLRK